MDDVAARRDRMVNELSSEISNNQKRGRRNYAWALALVIIATIASVAASLLAFLDFDHNMVGIISLIPAAAATGLNQLKFQEKANWFYEKGDRLRTLFNEIKFELLDPPTHEPIVAISRKWSTINETMSQVWNSRMNFSLASGKDQAKS